MFPHLWLRTDRRISASRGLATRPSTLEGLSGNTCVVLVADASRLATLLVAHIVVRTSTVLSARVAPCGRGHTRRPTRQAFRHRRSPIESEGRQRRGRSSLPRVPPKSS